VRWREYLVRLDPAAAARPVVVVLLLFYAWLTYVLDHFPSRNRSAAASPPSTSRCSRTRPRRDFCPFPASSRSSPSCSSRGRSSR
jgi:hypothetical protein